MGLRRKLSVRVAWSSLGLMGLGLLCAYQNCGSLGNTGKTVGGANSVSAAYGPSPGQSVTVRNLNSNMCLDTGAGTNSTFLTQQPCSGGLSQHFIFSNSTVYTGTFYLFANANNICWDMNGGLSGIGALVTQSPCLFSDLGAEIFKIVPIGNSGNFTISTAIVAPPNMCMGIVGSSIAGGAQIEMNTCNSSAVQTFQFGL
jgi:hypothetical protein